MPIRLNGPGRIRKCADGLQNTLDEFRALLMARDTRVHRRSQSRQRCAQVQPVFNLKVMRAQSFFVGARGMLVHDNSAVESVSQPFDIVPGFLGNH